MEYDMYENMYEKFKDDLIDGEEILWSGKPESKSGFSIGNVFLIFFGIIWLSFSLFMEYNAIMVYIETGFIIMALFGLPFVFIGFFLLFGLPLYAKKKKKSVYYAVTNKRLIIVNLSKKSKNVQTEFIKDLKGINKIIRKNGIGTIVFGNNPALAYMGANYTVNTYGNNYGNYYGAICPVFYDIKDVEKVYRIVHEIWIKTH